MFSYTCSVNKVNEIFAQTFVIRFEGPDQKLECQELEGGGYRRAALHVHELQNPPFCVLLEQSENQSKSK